MPDITPVELKTRLAHIGVLVSVTALRRYFRRHGIPRKKTRHATKQDRPDVRQAREDWFEDQVGLDPEQPIFIDETGTSPRWRAPTGAPRAESGCGPL